MGFTEVYESLLETFPLIDTRALRAVAIEHSKDADVAAKAVLEEVIPFFAERLRPDTPSTWSISADESSKAPACASVRSETVDGSSPNALSLAEIRNGYNVNAGYKQLCNDAGYEQNDYIYDTYDGCQGDDSKLELMMPEKLPDNKIQMSTDVCSPGDPIILTDKTGADVAWIEVSEDPKTEDIISDDSCPESITKYDNTSQTLGILQDVDTGKDQRTNLIQESEEHSSNLGTDCSRPSNEENDLGVASADNNNFCDRTSSSTVYITPLECSVQFVEVPNVCETIIDKLGATDSTMAVSKVETVSSILSTKETLASNAAMSQFSQVQAIDVLEEVIANSRNIKTVLFTAMESVISLMREVEVKERAAENAKEEAARGVAHTLDKVEELKQMLQHAKEANDMHAGEVHGEKAILVTELRELQTRVLSLSDERDKALGILDEMKLTLEVRLAAAQNVINSAEQEKLEKEEAAQKSFADLELGMEQVVQVSKILKQQADDNSKLQEFLLDRGQVVDVLQGEIAVICQDVKQLKEKFDKGVPLSKSLFSGHTSFILASSSLSTKTSITDYEEPVLDRDDSVPTQEGGDHEQVTDAEEPIGDYEHNALLDGWDILDKHEIHA